MKIHDEQEDKENEVLLRGNPDNNDHTRMEEKKKKLKKRKYDEELLSNRMKQDLAQRSSSSSPSAQQLVHRTIPRHPHEEIRYLYPLMAVNVLNAMDKSLLANFLQQFTHPNTVVTRTAMSRLHQNKEVERLLFYGPNAIFRYAYLLMFLSPDRIMRLRKGATVITNRKTFQTIITMEFEISLTPILKTNPIRVGRFLNRLQAEEWIVNNTIMIDKKKKNNKDSNENEISEDVSHFEELLQKQFMPVRLLPHDSVEENGARNNVSTASSSNLEDSVSSSVGKPRKYFAKMLLKINNHHESELLDEIIFEGYDDILL